MLNIKTSDPYDLKPVELTPAELDSVAGGQVVAAGALTAAAIIALDQLRRANEAARVQSDLNNIRKAASEMITKAVPR
jgi:hypothetical protein